MYCTAPASRAVCTVLRGLIDFLAKLLTCVIPARQRAGRAGRHIFGRTMLKDSFPVPAVYSQNVNGPAGGSERGAGEGAGHDRRPAGYALGPGAGPAGDRAA